MKFVRFCRNDEVVYGVVDKDCVREIEGDIFSDCRALEHRYPLEECRLLAPCSPSKIVAVGLNYRTHAEELKMEIPEEPLLFLKPPTAVIGPGEPICFPDMSQRVDYEAELGVVVGRTCRQVSLQDAPDAVFGYTCFNDVTARDLQQKDVQFTRSKSFDTFAPMGPWIETDTDPDSLLVESFLNGEKRQSQRTGDLIFPVYELVSFISRVMTLYPGDVIATGTPSGIGPMQVGDEIEIRVEGIGSLKNTVVRQ